MKSWLRKNRAVLAAMLLATLPACALTVRADSTDERYLAGLRQRQLYRLAEAYCVQRLGESELPIERRAELVVELSRTLAEQAWQSPPAAADELWRRAMEAPANFARDNATAPGALLARVQTALVLLARGELLRQQAEASENDQTALAEARGYLRTALRELSTSGDQVAEQLRALGKNSSDKPGSLSRAELLSMQTNLRYQLARGYRNRALCYAADTPDRQDALLQAKESLNLLAELDAEDPLHWLSRLEIVACLRQARDFDEAAERLTALTADGPPDDIRRRAEAERIELALDRQSVDEALRLVGKVSPADSSASPELAYACLEAQLAAWRLAASKKDTVTADRFEEQAAAAVEEIQRSHGPYWTRRAESLLAGGVASAGGGNNLTVMVRAAEADYRAGRIDAALAAYDRAREQFAQMAQPAEAFKLAYVAASIEHERRSYAAAAKRYRELSLALPQDPRAAEAHMLAIFNAGQLAKSVGASKNAGSKLDDEYVALLDEHLQSWPDDPSVAQALMLRGRLEERRGDWAAAVAAFQQVPSETEQFAAAVEAAARAYASWLTQRQADRQPAADIAAKGARWFESLVLGTDNRWPQRWGATDRTAALAAARLWLAAESRDAARAEKLLTESLSGSAGAEEEDVVAWVASAHCLLVVAQARQGRLADARATVDQLETVSPTQLQQVLDELTALSTALPKKQQKELAELQGRVARLAGGRDGQLSDAAQRSIELAQARALSAGGRTAEAIEAFAGLAKKYPREGQIQEDYALALSAAKDRKTLELAQEKWHEVEKKSRPGGERWLRARYELATVLYRLGDHDRAATVITSTQALYPSLGGPELQGRFQSLLQRVQKK